MRCLQHSLTSNLHILAAGWFLINDDLAVPKSVIEKIALTFKGWTSSAKERE
jgi:hypothetical protein